jgi:heme-degrading monooxygenase HmoA
VSVAVVNRISLTADPDELTEDVARELPPVIRGLPGFEAFHFVRTGDREATAIILWADAEAAKAGADIIGPTVFHAWIAPHASAQERVVGRVLVSAVPD